MLFKLSGLYLAKASKQANNKKHAQISKNISFPNKNKLNAILSINLQLYNYCKYISCVKV